MRASLATDGYEVCHKVADEACVQALREEVDLIAKAAGTACVRHLRARSKMIDALSRSSLVQSLLPDGLIPVRSILFDKTPTANWPVAWHQDLTIAVAEERAVAGYGAWSHKDGSPHVQAPVALLEKMVTVRLHLDETSESNGALQVVPGSHLGGRLSVEAISETVVGESVVCVCEPGDVLLMSPLILHASRRSELPGRRRVIHLEYARADDLDPALAWFED